MEKTFNEHKEILIQDTINKYTNILYDIAYDLAQFWPECNMSFPFWKIKFTFIHKPTDED